ncbi:hypothetical protein HPP92_017156 [Vanilla planifolia]|uniref:Ionotropic glutamate receptor C-terminal domain-containing protein n=1 Tax=Vanilla planifolia TaxID=51239 RepID=A0A835USU9_VANPL|nr:hypothetical protein HPP92_017156 [Vanilla planifolia]
MTLFCFLFVLDYESTRAYAAAQTPSATVDVPVGVILDLQTQPGKKSLISIQMAIEDFYASRPNFTTRVVLHVRDSKQNAVEAASAAVDLMKNTKVAAIIGPVTSEEAEFVAILGSKTQTPVISYSASSASVSVIATPYFVRATIKDSDQSPLLAAIVKYYGWHDIIPVYEDSAYGSGILPSLIDALQSVDARVPYRTAIAPFATDDHIIASLYHLKTLSSRVFVVHMTPSLASRFFRLAASTGMVAEGYAWIATDSITNVVDMDGALDLSVMQGVIGVMPHVPKSPELEQFTARWMENPREYEAKPSIFSLWAYDATQAVALANFDAVVGDTTILSNRTGFVDFTLPYTDSGVAMLVPMEPGTNRNYWIFLKPLTTDLWLGTLTFFFFTGLVVWAIEHRINPEFRGRPSDQIGTTLFFVFSTLVFSHREKLESNLSRLVVVIWVFVVLIITSSYTASLTSMLTVQQLQPVTVNIEQLVKSTARVGYQDGSFVYKMLQKFGFTNERLQNYSTPEQYKDAMLNGSSRGGVDAIFDEIPYLKLFMSKYCSKFTMAGRIYKTDGFGFVFPRDSPLVPDVSRAILNVTEGDIMMEIERKWFGDQKPCLSQSEGVSSTSLNFSNFGGLFLITGTVSVFALLIYILVFLRKEWDDVRAATLDAGDRGGSFWDKAAALAKHYDSIKDKRGSGTARGNMEQELSCNGIISEGPQTPISISEMSALNCVSQQTVASGRTSTEEMPTEQFIELRGLEPRRGN